MRAMVDEHCIGCGLCVGACPEVFTMADTGVAVGVAFPVGEVNAVEEAAQACPVGAIHVEN